MRKFISIILALVLTFSLVACNSSKDAETSQGQNEDQGETQGEEGTRTIIDGNGNEVTITKDVKRVVNLWNSANEIIVQLGAGDIFVGGSSFLEKMPWMMQVFPEAKDIEIISDGSVANVEAVLDLEPDVIFSVAGRADALKEIGEPVVELTGGSNPEELMEQMRIVAEAMGEEYVANAEEFFTYFNKNLDLVEERAAKIPEDEKIVVLHGDTETTTLGDSLVGSLMKIANVTNAFEGSEAPEISYEQIIKADPDVILVGYSNHEECEKFTTDPLYKDVSAVKNDRVFINPSGLFFWDAFSGEMCLEILWMAKTFYPEHFEDIDLIEETKYFYKTFLDYDMSEEEIEYLYEGKGPNGEWQ